MLKLEKNLDSADSQNAIAISVGQKDYSYGHLLQSAFQISRLLQNGKGDISSKTNGAVASNKVKGPKCSRLFQIVLSKHYELPQYLRNVYFIQIPIILDIE